MRNYFQLQLRIVQRFLTEWRLAPWLVALVVPVLFVLGSLLLLERTAYAALAIMVLSWSGFAWLSGSQRNYFLRITYPGATYRKIRLWENTVIILPIVLLFVGKGLGAVVRPEASGVAWWYWGALALVQGLVGTAMAYRVVGGRASLKLPTPFSRQPFEFAVGFRRAWWLLVFAIFLLIMGVRAQNFELGAFAWFMTVFGALNFYQKPEPGFYVWVHALSGRQLLLRKLRIGNVHLLILGLPFVLTLLVAFPARWLLVVVGLVLASAYLTLFIVAKYAAYPNEIDLVNAFIIAFGFVVPPLMIFLIPYYFKRAALRLQLVLS